MKTAINPPAVSKINYTALLIQIIGLLVVFDVVPVEHQETLTEATLIIGPALIQIWRTWFTKP
mgnify:CR=1 FL=1